MNDNIPSRRKRNYGYLPDEQNRTEPKRAKLTKKSSTKSNNIMWSRIESYGPTKLNQTE